MAATTTTTTDQLVKVYILNVHLFKLSGDRKDGGGGEGKYKITMLEPFRMRDRADSDGGDGNETDENKFKIAFFVCWPPIKTNFIASS